MNSILYLEDTALELKALVTVMSAIDSDNKQALQEMPIVAGIASEMAERLYCAIADARAQEVR